MRWCKDFARRRPRADAVPTTALLLDPAEVRELIRRRRRLGLDRFDEVWDGVYVMAAMPNMEHQSIVGRLVTALTNGLPEGALVLPGCNVSDQSDKWEKNFRCPDVAVVLPGNTAENRGTHLFGGPDFAIEIVSPKDRSRDKLGFYFKVGVRELLIVDRKPWKLELYRNDGSALALVGTCPVKKQKTLVSSVIPFRFTIAAGTSRPSLVVTCVTDNTTTRI
jgi:Uma2 family endonuclease